VVRGGAVIDATDDDPRNSGIRAMFDRMAASPRLEATAIQLVGLKGHDGLALARVLD
jgi:predicted O-methyltransferase YrrM